VNIGKMAGLADHPLPGTEDRNIAAEKGAEVVGQLLHGMQIKIKE